MVSAELGSACWRDVATAIRGALVYDLVSNRKTSNYCLP